MSEEAYSHSVVAGDIPAEGRHYKLEAKEDERRRLAEAMGIPDVLSFHADIHVRPVRGQAFSVRGTLRASVVQTDVVTLDPVTQEVAEEIDVTLLPAEGYTAKGKVLVDPEDMDGPDLYRNGRIDLGVIASEHLALGLDPYPRAPDAAFNGYVEDDPQADPNPFAALAALQRRGE